MISHLHVKTQPSAHNHGSKLNSIGMIDFNLITKTSRLYDSLILSAVTHTVTSFVIIITYRHAAAAGIITLVNAAEILKF